MSFCDCSKPSCPHCNNNAFLHDQEEEPQQHLSSEAAASSSSTAVNFSINDGNSNCGTATEPEQSNFCDLCKRRTMVLAERAGSSEPSCPHCNHGFLEEHAQETEQEPSTSTIQDENHNHGFYQLIPRPASKWAIKKLATIKVSQELLNSDWNECEVCKEEFKIGEELKKLPCPHMYHKDCILKWLALRDTCPKCRRNLPDGELERLFQEGPAGVEMVMGGVISLVILGLVLMNMWLKPRK